jgi:hypothetical protein
MQYSSAELLRRSYVHVIDYDFVAVEKPFTLAIRVAGNAYHTAVARHTKHLGHRSYLADQRGKQPWARLDEYPISHVEVVLGQP